MGERLFAGFPSELYRVRYSAPGAPWLADRVKSLILGTGNITHNLRRTEWLADAAPPGWALDFDAWIADALVRRDWAALLDYPRRAPHLALAQPTDDHLRPLLVTAGAGLDDPVSFPIEGWEYGSLSRRSVVFG